MARISLFRRGAGNGTQRQDGTLRPAKNLCRHAAGHQPVQPSAPVRTHDDQVGVDVDSQVEDLGRRFALLYAVLDIDRPVGAVELAQPLLDGFGSTRLVSGDRERDGRLAEVHRLVPDESRPVDMEDDDPGRGVHGERAGQAVGVMRVLREVGREQNGPEGLHGSFPRWLKVTGREDVLNRGEPEAFGRRDHRLCPVDHQLCGLPQGRARPRQSALMLSALAPRKLFYEASWT